MHQLEPFFREVGTGPESFVRTRTRALQGNGAR